MENAFVGNKGYVALGKQTDKDTAIVPSVFVPYYSENVVTNMNKNADNSIQGNLNAVQNVYPGLRTHRGDLEILAEPNTAAHILNMLMTLGSSTGSDPYTHPFTVGDTEKYYTMDIQKGKYVHRYVGTKVNTLSPDWSNDGVLHFNLNITALESFSVAKLAGTPTFTDPTWNAVFDTDYDPSPTTGLVVGDTLIFDDGSTETEATITAINDGDDIEVDADVTGFGAGDTVRIKAQTASYTLREPFHWGRTEFRLAADASTALSAAHTPVDDPSTFELMWSNENDDGAHQSGSYDPSDIRRTVFNSALTLDTVFEDENEALRYRDNEKRACVIRCFSEGSTYELRITLNNMKITEQPKETESEGVVHIVSTFQPQYDTSDGQAVDVKVLNALSSI